MRLKLSAVDDSQRRYDVMITADVTVTVHEIARKLVLGFPKGHGLREAVYQEDLPLTLRVRYPDEPEIYHLDHLATIAAAGLRSGAWVQPIRLNGGERGDLMFSTQRAELIQRSAPGGAANILASGKPAFHGSLYPLYDGVNTVGRSRQARVKLVGKTVSRKHAAIEVNNGIGILRDLGSVNGVTLNGKPVREAQLSVGDQIELGGYRFEFSAADHTAMARPSMGKNGHRGSPVIEFVRSPRVEHAFGAQSVEIPSPPAPPQPQRMPMIAALAPVALGVVTMMSTGSWHGILVVALSPLMLLSGLVENRVRGAKQYRKELDSYQSSLDELGRELVRSHERERETRQNESPGAEQSIAAMLHRDALLWCRRPEHHAFGELRFGLGADQSMIEIVSPARGQILSPVWQNTVRFREQHSKVRSVPIREHLADCGSVAVVGPESLAEDVYRALIMQLAGLHSPAEMVLTACADHTRISRWEWLKWLPQVDSPYSPLRGSHLASNERSKRTLINRLEEVLELRKMAMRGGSVPSSGGIGGRSQRQPATESSAIPIIVVLVMHVGELDMGRLVRLAEQGPDYGIHTLWLKPGVADIPAACRTFVEVSDTTGLATVNGVLSGRRLPLTSVDRVDLAVTQRAARALAAVQDAGAQVRDETDLPIAITFGEVTAQDVVNSHQAVVASWRSSDSLSAHWQRSRPRAAGNLRVTVGEGVEGAFTLDLRDQGPHALVAGTTGAGKSEFLQTWIMALAARFSPERVTFLLVDYKGGTAFAECNDLPHTVGLVTDLNQHLVRRALVSLRAELRYREELLNAKGIKDLKSLEAVSDPDAPPTLVIVIDEFAALAKDMPEFVDGVVDIAARGRSLGVHLIMATQRPSGVITDNLRANTNLRVALRVADPTESRDIIDTDQAAFFEPSMPGRGAVRVGPGRITDFQTAYIGAPADHFRTEPDLVVTALPFEQAEEWSDEAQGRGAEARRPANPGQPREKEIERLLRSIVAANELCSLSVPRKPWMEPLPSLIGHDDLIESLEEPFDVVGDPSDNQSAHVLGGGYLLGLSDRPSEQAQTPLAWFPEVDGNLAIYGTSGSGKSTALRALTGAATSQFWRDPVHIYALDCTGGGLATLEALSTVGSIVDGDDVERVTRLIRMLGREIRSRTVCFARTRASTLSEYRSAAPSEQVLPRILLLVDGIGALRQRYEMVRGFDPITELTTIIGGGRPVGIHVALTADRPSAVATGMLANIQRTVVLRMANANDYGALGVGAEALEDAPPGRCVVDGLESQLCTLGGAPSLMAEESVVIELERRTAGQPGSAAPEIRRLPEHIDAGDLPGTDPLGRPVFAVRDDELAPMGFTTDGIVVVQGRFRSGTTTTLQTMIRALAAVRADLESVLLSPRRSPLREATAWSVRAETEQQVTAALAVLLQRLGLVTEPMATQGRNWLEDDDWLRATPEIENAITATPEDGSECAASASAASRGDGAQPQSLLVVVEQAAEFGGLACEPQIARLLAACRGNGFPALVESDPATISAAWNTYSVLKSARAGVLMRPEDGDAASLFRVSLPRENHAQQVPGRGFYVENGNIAKIQVARS